MKINSITKKNPLIKKFEQYLLLNYSNEKTKELYLKEARRFLFIVMHDTKSEPTVLTQDLLDRYIIFLRSKIRPNPFYIGFIGAWRNCFDPEDEYGRRHLAFKIPKNRSREHKQLDEYDWLSKKLIDLLIEKTNTYMSLTIQIFWETGLRKMELINSNLSHKRDNEIGIKIIDFNKRRLVGIGKGGKEFIQPFSKELGERIKVWLTECQDPIHPFMIFKPSGIPYKNQDKQYWQLLNKESKNLNIQLPNGKLVHAHAIRHSICKWLRQDKKWQIEDVGKFARHESTDTTKIYSGSTIEEVEKKLNEEVFNNNEKTE